MGHAGGRSVPQDGDIGRDVLQVAQEVWWLGPFELRQLKQLEEENSKLKRLVADLSLDKAMLQDVLRRKL
jgi:hypothetical protein